MSPRRPRCSTCSLRMISMFGVLIGDVGNQRELTRALDGHLQLALMERAGAGNPARLNLAALGQKRRQQPHVLVIDVVDLLRAELAYPAAAEESTARRIGASLGVLLVSTAPAAASSFFPHRWTSKPSMSSEESPSPRPSPGWRSGGKPRATRRRATNFLRASVVRCATRNSSSTRTTRWRIT